MATRSTIKIEGLKFAKLYKHWDGYPEAMMPFLTKFNEDFTKTAVKGVDEPTYKLAQLIRATERLKDEFNLDDSIDSGYAVVRFNEVERGEYEYVLKKDGSVSFVKV